MGQRPGMLPVVVLPTLLRERRLTGRCVSNPRWGKIGITVLPVQAVTGALLATRLIPDFADRSDSSNPVAHMVVTKLTLLALTAPWLSMNAFACCRCATKPD